MAQPNGAQAEPAEVENELESVAQGKNTDERSDAAFRALEAGYEPHEVNRYFNKPLTDDEEPDDDPDAGTAQGKPEEAAGSKQTDAEQTPPPDAEKSGDEGEQDAEKLERFLAAKRVLQRDQLTEADIERLGMDRAIELADQRVESHREIDRRFSQTSKKGEQDDQDAGHQEQSETDDLSGVLEEIEEFDTELAEKVKGLLEGNAQQVQAAQKELQAHRFGVTIERVKGRFPELSDDTTFNRVLEKAKVLAKSPAYETADAAFEDAATLLLSPGREQRAQDRLLEENRQHRDGQIDTDTTLDDGAAKPMSQDERDSHAFKLLQAGKTPKEVNAILRKIPYPNE